MEQLLYGAALFHNDDISISPYDNELAGPWRRNDIVEIGGCHCVKTENHIQVSIQPK
jgi:hypothetical protein